MAKCKVETPSLRAAIRGREHSRKTGDKVRSSDARFLRDEYPPQPPKGTPSSPSVPPEGGEMKQLAPTAGLKASMYDLPADITSKQALLALSAGFDSLTTRKVPVKCMLDVLELATELNLLKGNSGPVFALACAMFTVEGFGWHTGRLFDEERDPYGEEVRGDVRFLGRAANVALERLVARQGEFKAVFERYSKQIRKQRQRRERKKTVVGRV